MPALRIIHRSSVLQGRELTLDLPVVRLGRDATCQVLFDENADRSVSRQHAELRWEGDRLYVAAMPGKVVLLRGVPVTAPTVLQPGDVVELAGPGGPSVEVQWNAPRRAVLGAASAFDVDDTSKTAANIPAFVPMPAVAPAPSQPPPKAPDDIPMAVAVQAPLPAPVSRPMPAVAPQPPVMAPAPPPPAVVPMAVPVASPEPPVRPAPWLPPAVSALPTPLDTPRVAPEPPPPAPQAPAPEPYAKHATMILPALDPSALDPAQQSSTQFLKISDLAPAPPPKKQQWVKSVAVGGAVVALVVAGLGGFFAYQHSEQRRQAIERVERLKEALKNRTAPPQVSDEDWKIYEEEYRVAHHAEPPPLEPPKAKTDEKPAAAPQEELEAKKREAEEKKRKAEELAKARAEVRQLFAAVKRTELQRLALGRKAPPPSLVEERKAALAAYEAALAKLPPEQMQGGVDAMIRQTARYLGECDGAMPAKFVSEAKAAIEKFKKDPAERSRLIDTIKKADENRYGPTITAALGDQLVPVELYFVPFEMSRFDDRKVGFVTALGYPKGMWQLAPSVAERFGLKVGAGAANPGFDGGDERHKYEKEARAAAKAMRALYAGPAAGSAMLVLATYANGDDGLLKELKQKAGLAADDTDPARVSLWKLYEAGALPEDQHKLATDAFAAITIASQPSAFGFDFAPPLKHVALADE